MYLNRFSVSFSKVVRVGRGMGSGLGKTCGKGHKGQRSRSGFSMRSCFEGGQTPLHIRLPKFGFKSKSNKYQTEISTDVLNLYKDIYYDLDVLKKYKIINKNIKFVKIVYSEKLNRNIMFGHIGIKLSKKVKSSLTFNEI